MGRDDPSGGVRRGRIWLCIPSALLVFWWAFVLSAPNVWVMDIAASFALPGLLFIIAVWIVVRVRVRARFPRGMTSGTLIALALIVIARDRVLYLPAASSQEGVVTIFNLSVRMNNKDPKEVLDLLRECGADVIVVNEPVWDVFAELTRFDALLEEYPYRISRERVGEVTSPIVVLSRWAIEADESLDPVLAIGGVIDPPGEGRGSFAVYGFRAASPRTAAGWAQGNETVRDLAAALRLREAPVVLVGDLNSGPIGSRDRDVRRRLGLARGKPILLRGGTYPAGLPILRVSIDDIWVSDHTPVIGWETVRVPGSDHRGVRATIRISE